MSKAFEFITAIDSCCDMASLKFKGNQVWPFLRQIYFFQYYRLSSGFHAKKQIGIFRNIWRLRNIFYGVCNWFKRYDYVFITSTGSRRLLDHKYVNKDAEWLLQELGKKNSLLVEFSETGKYFKRQLLSDENIVSGDFFNMIGVLPSVFRNIPMENEQILSDINQKHDLCVNYRWAIFAFFRLVSIFTLFYRLWKPKVLFVTCYYNMVHQAAIFAAKKAGIKVVELQHGVIVSQHPAYNFACELDHSFFPDYILCYGETARDVFVDGNRFINPENALPVGNGYIEYSAGYRQEPRDLKIAVEGYEKVVAVTSDWMRESKIIEFLEKASCLSDRILYVFIPRDISKDYLSFGFPKNIVILKNLDFYRITGFVDFHSTVVSTCALEAPSLGTPNILIDIEGWSSFYYESVLKDRDVSRIVSTPAEYVEMILGWNRMPREEIISAHNAFCRPDHRSNLREALGFIGCK